MVGEKIIGELSINRSVQFICIYDIWGSGFPFIPKPRATYCFNWWGITGDTISNGNPGSSAVTGIWGESFDNSTVNWSENWNGSINASPDDLPQSPIFPFVD